MNNDVYRKNHRTFLTLLKDLEYEKEVMVNEGTHYFADSALHTLEELITNDFKRVSFEQKNKWLSSNLALEKRTEIESIMALSQEEENILATIRLLIMLLSRKLSLTNNYYPLYIDLIEQIIGFLKKQTANTPSAANNILENVHNLKENYIHRKLSLVELSDKMKELRSNLSLYELSPQDKQTVLTALKCICELAVINNKNSQSPELVIELLTIIDQLLHNE